MDLRTNATEPFFKDVHGHNCIMSISVACRNTRGVPSKTS